MTPQPRHSRHDVRVAVACHSTSHTRTTVLSDSRSAMQMNLDPQPHTYHPGPFPSPQRSAWLKYSWRCIFYIELGMGVHMLDVVWLLIQVNFSRHFFNRRPPRGPPFCQKSALADVRRMPHKIGRTGPVLSTRVTCGRSTAR